MTTDPPQELDAAGGAESHSEPMGAPTAYRPEYAAFAGSLCEQGATDQEVADILRVHRSTLYRWLAAHQELRDAMRLGKAVPNQRVERAFYQRAVGYDIEVEKCFQYQGAPVRVRTTEHIPADTSAAHHWLCNRDPENWRNRKELTGPNGGAIELKSVIEFIDAADQPSAVSE